MNSVTLQSKEHRDLLDIIDKLRSRGISRYVDLPEIVVCGDQSSGKSSVLEAISGMSFPTKDNLCTRFATELVLRRSVAAAAKISINPGPDRSPEEKERLGCFSAEVDLENPGIGIIVERAKEAMGLSDSKVFSTDVLRVELSGPSQPHLTLVDLPGLFRAGNSDQSIDDAKIVKKMVQNYVKRPRSIILAVVSAKNDLALQDVTEMTREFDPKGIRTLGLITKPDTLDAGSDSEAAYFRLAQNRDIKFRLGWHVLKNRDYKTRQYTSAERDDAEETFFKHGIWTNMPSKNLGIHTLKPRLSNLLKDQILRHLPSLLVDVNSGISATTAQLNRLGSSRATTVEQRRYLLQVSGKFTTLMQAAIDGNYKDRFFGDAISDEGYNKRLRALVQNTLTDFEEQMQANGQSRNIVDFVPTDDGQLSSPTVSRSDYISEVKNLMKRSRGCELPGTFNPQIIGELFAEQCKPWAQIVREVEATIVSLVQRVAHTIVNHVAAEATSAELTYFVDRSIEPLKEDLNLKIKELLEPHFEGHPSTFNHYLTDTVQKIQADRRERDLDRAFRNVAGGTYDDGYQHQIDLGRLFNSIKKQMESNMDRYASEQAVDYMQAYYKVARKKFVDDIAVLAVEHCLVSKLPSLFNPEKIMFELTDNEIHTLAAEGEGASAERARCIEKLAVLETCTSDLKRLGARQLPDSEPLYVSDDSDDGDDSETSASNEKVNGQFSDSHSIDSFSPETIL